MKLGFHGCVAVAAAVGTLVVIWAWSWYGGAFPAEAWGAYDPPPTAP